MAVLGALLWGSSLPAFKAISVAIPPLHIALIQFTAATLVLQVYLRGVHPEQLELGRGSWRIIALWSLFGAVIPMILQNFSILHTTATETGVLQQLDPVFTLVLALLLLGERVGRRALLGGLVALVGALLLSSGGRLEISTSFWGNLGMVGVGLSYAVSHIVARRALDRGLPPLVLVAHGLFIAIGVFFLLAWLESPLEVLPSIPLWAWLLVVGIGMFSTALGSILYFSALRSVPVHRVASVLFLIPMVAALLGGIFLGEQLNLWTLFTGLMILAGVALTIQGPAAAAGEEE